MTVRECCRSERSGRRERSVRGNGACRREVARRLGPTPTPDPGPGPVAAHAAIGEPARAV